MLILKNCKEIKRMKGLKDLAEGLISRQSGLGTLSALGLVCLFVTMTGIIYWTFRPSSRDTHEKMSRITVE